MQWLKRHWGWMLVAFALSTVLVFGGLTWATIVSLELQHAEAERQRERALDFMLDKATSMMDDALGDQLYLEDRRAISEYKHASCQEPYGCVGSPKVLTELDKGVLPPWILGHFQVSGREGWYSPPRFVEVENGVSPATLELFTKLFEQEPQWYVDLYQNLQYEDVHQQVSDMAWFRDFRSSGLVSLQHENNGRPRNSHDPSQSVEYCLPESLAYSGLFDSSPEMPLETDNGAVEESNDSTVYTYRLLPVWLKPTPDEARLTYIRPIELDTGEVVYQGFVIDWDRLTAELLYSVRRELFPSARLARVVDRPTAPSLALMKNLPAQLETGESVLAAVDGGWTVIHGAIAAAWVSALSIFAAIVLGLRNLISFAERRMQFTYDVTHELRTPLTTMRLYTDMLSNGVVKDEATKQEYLQTLDRETERLSGLVAGVLEYARVEHHAPKLDQSTATLGEIIQETQIRWEPYCEREGHKFVTEINGLASAPLKTDRRLVQQVLNILVDNACKYGRSEAEPSVTVRALKLNDGRIAIDVEDNGPGVAARDRKSIFRPFRRGSLTEVGGMIPTGIGLGLALARRWAKLLGGRVECVKSEKQTRGACFRLTLPKKAQVSN